MLSRSRLSHGRGGSVVVVVSMVVVGSPGAVVGLVPGVLVPADTLSPPSNVEVSRSYWIRSFPAKTTWGATTSTPSTTAAVMPATRPTDGPVCAARR